MVPLMARDHAQLQLAIWADDDFRALSCSAQHLYFILLTSPQLSYCGTTDWRPAKLTGMVGDWTLDTVLAAAAELINRLYIVVDESTEEVLVRSFVRHDGLMKMPKMATAMATAHAAVGSPVLRRVVVWELQRLHQEEPEIPGWRSETATALLDKPSVDPSTYPCGNPYTNPSGNPPGNPSGNPSGNPKPEGSGYPPVSPYSLLHAPSSFLLPDSEGFPRPPLAAVPEPTEATPRRKAAHPLPENFDPVAETGAWITEHRYNRNDVDSQTERFRSWALSKDARYVDWIQAWQNWIRKAADQGQVRKRGDTSEPIRHEWQVEKKR